jgi:hypothetical protein
VNFSSAIDLMRNIRRKYSNKMVLVIKEPSKYMRPLRTRRLSPIDERNTNSEDSICSTRKGGPSTASELDHIDFSSTLGFVPIYEEESNGKEVIDLDVKNVEELLDAVTVMEEDSQNNILLRPRLMRCNSMAVYLNKDAIKDKPIKYDVPRLNFHRISSVASMRNQRHD